MKVIFLQDVKNVAQVGEIKTVKDGFARNYLIPKEFAVQATKSNIARWDKKIEKERIHALKRVEDAELLAGKLNGKELTFLVKSGDAGKLFGAVTNQDIADKISKDIIELDKKMIEHPPIKEIGVHEVKIHIFRDVKASVNVIVQDEDEAKRLEADKSAQEAAKEAAEAKAEEVAAEPAEDAE